MLGRHQDKTLQLLASGPTNCWVVRQTGSINKLTVADLNALARMYPKPLNQDSLKQGVNMLPEGPRKASTGILAET